LEQTLHRTSFKQPKIICNTLIELYLKYLEHFDDIQAMYLNSTSSEMKTQQALSSSQTKVNKSASMESVEQAFGLLQETTNMAN